MPRSAPNLGGGSVTLDERAFEARFNMPLVHEAVRAELNARRVGCPPGSPVRYSPCPQRFCRR